MEMVQQDLYSLVLTEKDGIDINEIEHEYSSLIGQRLIFDKTKYKNLEEFILSMPDRLEIIEKNNSKIVIPIVNNKVAKIRSLIKNQRTSPKKNKFKPNFFSRSNKFDDPYKSRSSKFDDSCKSRSSKFDDTYKSKSTYYDTKRNYNSRIFDEKNNFHSSKRSRDNKDFETRRSSKSTKRYCSISPERERSSKASRKNH